MRALHHNMPHQTVSRKSSRWLVVWLCGLVLALLLAGCGSLNAGPLVAASVDEQPVSLATYQRLLSVAQVFGTLQGGTSTWLTPGGRASLAAVQQGTLDFLSDALIIHEQARKLHATVNPKDVDAQLQLYESQFQNALSSDPTNQTYLQYKSAIAAEVKQHPRSTDQGALIAGSPDIGDAFNILSLQFAEEVALSSKVKVPQAHVSIIIVGSEKQANDIMQQAEQGTKDFAALAKQYSTDATTAANGGDIGTVYLSKLSQNGQAFDQDIFGPGANYTQPTSYVIVPFAGGFALCKITERTTIPVSSISDSQSQITAINAWLALFARPGAHIQTFVGIDVTPTPGTSTGQ